MRPARVSEDGECVIITLGLGPEQRLGGHHAVDQADALGFLSADDPARVPDLGRPARPDQPRITAGRTEPLCSRRWTQARRTPDYEDVRHFRDLQAACLLGQAVHIHAVASIETTQPGVRCAALTAEAALLCARASLQSASVSFASSANVPGPASIWPPSIAIVWPVR